MSCVENTNSIDLSVTGGQLEASLNVDPSTSNMVSVSSSGVLVSLNGGWTGIQATLAYSSADSPTYVATTSVDLTSLVPVGAKFRLVQSSTTLYFVVTAITSSTITLYGGTGYTLSNTTITNPCFSYMRTPLGFSTDPANWSLSSTNNTDATTASPSGGTWYNPGSISITIPIGCWRVSYKVAAGAGSGTGIFNWNTSLSTSNSSPSDSDFTAAARGYLSSNTTIDPVYVSKSVTLAVKTPYYLIIETGGAPGTIGFYGSTGTPTILQATCAYL